MTGIESAIRADDAVISKIELLSLRIDKLEAQSSTNDERRSRDDIWSQLAANVTAIVGLREAVVAESKCMKCFWAVLLLCGICGTALFIFETGKQYTENRSATNVIFIKNSSYNYPPLVVCTDAWMDSRKARATGLSAEAIKYSLAYFDDWHGLRVENASAARQEFADFYSRNGYHSLVDFYKLITIDFDRANGSNEWAATNISAYFTNAIDISSDAYFLNTGGVCARFRLSKADGAMSMSYDRGKIFIKTIIADGGEYNNPYFHPFPSWYVFYSRDGHLDSNIREFFPLPSNTAVTITFSAKRYVRMKWTDNDCSNQEIHALSSPLHCTAMCQETMYTHVLNCTHYYLINLPKSHGLDGICNLLDLRANDTRTLLDYVSAQDMEEIHRNISTTCSERCPDVCERTHYDANVASERSIGDNEVGLTKPIVQVLTSQNASAIIVKLMHTAMSEGGIMCYVEVSTYGFVDLITDVGGALGLFVGATVLTLCQMIVFLIRVIEKRWNKKLAS